MNEGLIPRRYAKALYKFAQEQGADARLYEQMKSLAKAFEQEGKLQDVVSNPFISDADKSKLMLTAAAATAEDTVLVDFLKLLNKNKRMPLVRTTAIAYIDIYRESHKIYEVEVITASPMDASEETRLKTLIQNHLDGGSMEYSSRIDADLIGGFVVKIDSEQLDASIKNDLKQMRLTLLSNQ
jgi:F-type H+-transporting ATPase subunit delta